jgi:hypothetical protein
MALVTQQAPVTQQGTSDPEGQRPSRELVIQKGFGKIAGHW